MEAPPGIGPGMRVLQTRALPLGHGAGWNCLYIIAEEMVFVKRFFAILKKYSGGVRDYPARRRRESAAVRERRIAEPRKAAEVIRNHRSAARRFSTQNRSVSAEKPHVAMENNTRKNAITTPAAAAPSATFCAIASVLPVPLQ